MVDTKHAPQERRHSRARLTASVRNAICGAIARGAGVREAAALVGATSGAIYNWLRRGRNEPRTEYRAFLRSLREAVKWASERGHRRRIHQRALITGDVEWPAVPRR